MTTGKSIEKKGMVNYLPDRTISKEQAMYLLKTIWPKAPETEVIKAGILCQQYGLNPLMRQVYLIEFGKEWVIVLGIKATRQIAQQALRKQGIRYTYADGPRVMSEKEQVKIRGKVEPDKIWAITILSDQSGNTYPGYGFWPANKQPYGTDKGNDALNMAFIRSERNALDKLAPGELPDIEVGDDTYIEGEYREAIEKGKEQFHRQVEKDIDDLWGEKPKASPTTGEITGRGTAQAPTSTSETHQPKASEVEGDGNSPESKEAGLETEVAIDTAWLRETLGIIGWSALDAVKWMNKQFNLADGGKTLSLTQRIENLAPEQRLKFVTHIQELRELTGK